MKTYRIPHTDLSLSRMAYGCAMLGNWDHEPLTTEDKVRASRLVHTAHDQGINVFDHADVYGFGKSEALFGQVLKDSPGLRQKIIIQSKCGQVFPANWQKWGDPIRVDLTREHIIGAVVGSLNRLSIDYLDILLLHAASTLVQPEEVARAFDELHQSGKVRYFGVSNYTASQIQLLKKAVRQPLIANQVRVGLGYPDAFTDGIESSVQLLQSAGGESYMAVSGSGTLDYCRLEDIQIQAWSPLRGDHLNPKVDSPPKIKAAAQKLVELARAKQSTPSTLALAWLLHHPAGILPVIGAANPAHIIDNCAADRLTLTDKEWYDLLAAAADLKVRAIHRS